ncbi:hypothetical protein C9374_003171 [Naegleria lovaniensis]|uniref:Uncharacterized protein n=1 Tax=Naegleria lovaniensis TaxID=51637 RepID=A0AA88KQ41_NAELO|nr:uncharacterized protein C9374_003171 [Naegleria lovaniensis]KAG2386022.1 hypothetical protein C9374_003171 [Naegleria lovaniensis]
MSDGWKYNFSCNCFSTSAFYRNSLVYNEYSYTRINTESPKINSLEGFETYFKKCADNLGICVSLLPKPTVISHQLFMKNSATGSIQFDWGQALFVLRNKIISTCEPALIASNVTCSIYSFLFQPVQKLALNTYLRANKPQQFIKEYQAFMKHESVVKCLDKFQVLLEIAKENEHEVQFILSKKFTTTPLYILELLDTLTISKHKELCKQVSIIPPNNANKKKKQDKDFSFKNFKLFNWRNDLLLKCLNISEEEFHNMKRAIMSTSINNRLFSH